MVLSCGNGWWNEGKRSVYNILDLSADGSGRETSLLSGFSLGGDSSFYCRTADKYAWTHPGLVINSSVISVFITQTEIDIQGSDSSGFLLRKKAPFFKHLETWKIFEKLFGCFIVLFMKAGSALQYLHTNKLPLFQVAFRFWQLSVHGFFLKMHNESFMAFLWPCCYEAVKYCNHTLPSFSPEYLHLSALWMSNVSCLMFNGCIKQRENTIEWEERMRSAFLYIVIYNHLDYM